MFIYYLLNYENCYVVNNIMKPKNEKVKAILCDDKCIDLSVSG